RRILTIVADPRAIGSGCEEAPALTDAEAVARRIRSDPDLDATAPVPVSIGGIPALQVDVVMTDAPECSWQLPGFSSGTPLLLKNAPFVLPGQNWARLYLLDLPGGSGGVLAIAICSSEEDHERALEVAAPIVDSIRFRAGP
ncbi:MAG TPA: hypothetical protein VNN79_24815, partial [Actinomycetota bacterium]|nr:hypothetical protein [Actinomycetota bacterium]